MTLHGTLEDFSSGGILRVLSSDGRSGAIEFGGEAHCTVYLHHGELYFASDEHTETALATALVRPGRLTPEGWSRAVDEAGGRPIVGELLVRHGAISADLLASVVLSVMYDPLISLFLSGEGDFEFEPGAVHWLGPFRAFPVDVIVAEVRRRVREADEWATVMPTLDVLVSACPTLPGNEHEVTLRRDEWELVAALVGLRSIRQLAADLGRGLYSTARIAHRLSRAGLVEVSDAHAPADLSLHQVPDLVSGEPHAPRVDRVSMGLAPVTDSTPALVHRGPINPAGSGAGSVTGSAGSGAGSVNPADPTRSIRPRRRGGLRVVGRGGAHRSRG